jgi:hypothetical protein
MDRGGRTARRRGLFVRLAARGERRDHDAGPHHNHPGHRGHARELAPHKIDEHGDHGAAGRQRGNHGGRAGVQGLVVGDQPDRDERARGRPPGKPDRHERLPHGEHDDE